MKLGSGFQCRQKTFHAQKARVVVHDKASHMVNHEAQMLNLVFGGALSEAGFRSWTGPHGSTTTWLASKLGDFYLHETVISHLSL